MIQGKLRTLGKSSYNVKHIYHNTKINYFYIKYLYKYIYKQPENDPIVVLCAS